VRTLGAALAGLLVAAALAGGLEPAPPEGASAEALQAAGAEALAALQAELADRAREHLEQLSSAGAWSPAQIEDSIELLLVDRQRALSEPEFLRRALPVATASLPEGAPAELIADLLVSLTNEPGLPLEALERLELAWGTLQRASLDRRVEPLASAEPGSSTHSPEHALRWSDLGPGPADSEIALSIFSLPSALFDEDQVEAFLRGVRELAADRAIAVLADRPRARALEPLADELDIHVSHSWGRLYSPWPRDAMSFLTDSTGHRVAVVRPDRQPTREDDSFMALELIQDLPAELYERIGPLSWAVAPVPFHNGNILRAAERSWISIHTVEPRVLGLLGLDRVPVESFASATGVRDYLRAAERAASEMDVVFGSPTRFIHPFPAGDDPAVLGASMRLLGGGAGYDLDSIVTLLADGGGAPVALVGDLAAGARLVGTTPATELAAFRAGYGLAGAPAEVRGALVEAQSTAPAAGLGRFLELVAGYLQAEGVHVRRLPLLLVPTSLLERSGDYPDAAFIVGWHNVVVERRGETRRAEGFASGLEGADDLARGVFAELGYELDLLPPLIESVLRNGGYRCASNHLRALD
jgi:hypothetical protein